MFDFFTESACQTDRIEEKVEPPLEIKKYESMPAEPESENLNSGNESEILTIANIETQKQGSQTGDIELNGEESEANMTAE